MFRPPPSCRVVDTATAGTGTPGGATTTGAVPGTGLPRPRLRLGATTAVDGAAAGAAADSQALTGRPWSGWDLRSLIGREVRAHRQGSAARHVVDVHFMIRRAAFPIARRSRSEI